MARCNTSRPLPAAGVIGNAAGMDFRGALLMVVPCPERAEEILLAGDMPCPRCRGVLRPFETGTVRGVGAEKNGDRDPAAGPLR